MTFTLSVALGRIGLYTTNTNGDPLGGACYSLNGGEPICDNGPQDGDSDDGVMRLTGLTPGDYTISQTTVPDGYQQAPDQTITVNPGARTRVDFVNELALGTLSVSVTDDQGNPVPGACVTATDAAGNATQVCDNQDPDQDATDGVIAIPNLAPGTPCSARRCSPRPRSTATWERSAGRRRDSPRTTARRGAEGAAARAEEFDSSRAFAAA